MRAVARQGLEDDQVEALGKLQAQIDAAADKPKKAKSLWRSGRAELKPVRDMLDDMSAGRSRCMYCEDNEGIDIEHFWPKSRFSGAHLCVGEPPTSVPTVQQQLQAHSLPQTRRYR